MPKSRLLRIFRVVHERPKESGVLHVNVPQRTMRHAGKKLDFREFNRQKALRFFERLCLEFPAEVGIVPLRDFTMNVKPALTGTPRPDLARVKETAPRYCRQYLMHVKDALKVMGQPVEIRDEGVGLLRRFTLDLTTDVEFFFPEPSESELDSLFCIRRHYLNEDYEKAMQLIDDPLQSDDESLSDVARARAAMYAFLCQLALKDRGDPGDFVHLRRSTCLTLNEQDFYISERTRLTPEERS